MNEEVDILLPPSQLRSHRKRRFITKIIPVMAEVTFQAQNFGEVVGVARAKSLTHAGRLDPYGSIERLKCLWNCSTRVQPLIADE